MGILQIQKECFACGTTLNLEMHHIIHGTANRSKSDDLGLTVWLCHKHHTGSNDAAHKNADFDLYLKKAAQDYYERNIGTREQFIAEFGKSYK